MRGSMHSMRSERADECLSLSFRRKANGRNTIGDASKAVPNRLKMGFANVQAPACPGHVHETIADWRSSRGRSQRGSTPDEVRRSKQQVNWLDWSDLLRVEIASDWDIACLQMTRRFPVKLNRLYKPLRPQQFYARGRRSRSIRRKALGSGPRGAITLAAPLIAKGEINHGRTSGLS